MIGLFSIKILSTTEVYGLSFEGRNIINEIESGQNRSKI